ncbi:DNA methyltransferase [Verrucomicrobium sp. 3C]|uniref:DNA methyltransferase n=1 Tax=Verrucomicrobium sp. 3C TaxID=1134055 RepID=UPI0012DF95D4|nr:DNA methyltransferase [Verrucomicrobium sp. 3C]
MSGIPEIRVRSRSGGEAELWKVEFGGMTVFDPETGAFEHKKAEELPIWLLDTDYDGCCFVPSGALFPRTEAWEVVGRALGGSMADRMQRQLAGSASFWFRPGRHRRIAVKTIDDRGTELLVVRSLPRERAK